MGHVVTAPLVIAAAENGSLHHVYQGAPLPAFIGQDERDRLAADGMIAEVEEPVEEPAKEPAPDPIQEPVEEPAKEPAPDPIQEPVEEPVEDGPGLERPAGNASLETWAAYALESGQASEDEIAGMSRDALRDKYGN